MWLRIQRSWSSISLRPGSCGRVPVPGTRTRPQRTKRLHLEGLWASHGTCPQSDLVPGTRPCLEKLAVRRGGRERPGLYAMYDATNASNSATRTETHRHRREVTCIEP